MSYLGLERAVETSNVLVAALPLTSRPRHLLEAALLRRMQAVAFLVNVGPGSVDDGEAVDCALDSGQLGGYAAEVFAMEDWALPGAPASVPGRLLRHTPLDVAARRTQDPAGAPGTAPRPRGAIPMS